jgi:hypothetical protein
LRRYKAPRGFADWTFPAAVSVPDTIQPSAGKRFFSFTRCLRFLSQEISWFSWAIDRQRKNSLHEKRDVTIQSLQPNQSARQLNSHPKNITIAALIKFPLVTNKRALMPVFFRNGFL